MRPDDTRECYDSWPVTGQRLAHYEVLDKNGSGGKGEVYCARDTRLDREVALKILPRDVAGNPERSARFEIESRAIDAWLHQFRLHDLAIVEIVRVPKILALILPEILAPPAEAGGVRTALCLGPLQGVPGHRGGGCWACSSVMKSRCC